MEVLRFSFSAVGPIILLIALGLLLRSQEMIRDRDLGTLTNLAFQVFLPVMAFNNTADIDFSAEFNGGLLAFCLAAVCGLVAALWFGLRPFVRDRELRGAMVHLLYRTNYLVLGVALMGNLYADEGVRVASMLIPATIIPYNLFAVLVLSAAAQAPSPGAWATVKKLLRDIATNHLILGCVLGTLYSLSGLNLPGVVDSALRSVGSVGTPLTIILLGAQLDFDSLRSNARLLAAGTLGRLVAVPLVMTALAVAVGFRGIELCCLFVVFASPCATSCAIMSRFYGVKPQLSAQMVVMTNSLCVASLFLGLSLLRLLDLI